MDFSPVIPRDLPGGVCASMHKCTVTTPCAPRHLLRFLWISIPRAEETLGTRTRNPDPLWQFAACPLPNTHLPQPTTRLIAPLGPTSAHIKHTLPFAGLPHPWPPNSMPHVFGSRDLMAGVKRVRPAFPPCPPLLAPCGPLRPRRDREGRALALGALLRLLAAAGAGAAAGPWWWLLSPAAQRSAELRADAQCWPVLFAD